MSDENTTDPPTSNAPDLPPEPVDAAPSTTADAKESSAPDLPPEPDVAEPPTTAEIVDATPSATKNAEENSVPVTAKATPPASADAGKHLECRSEPRIHVRWHADALIDGYDVYHGFIKDISSRGTDIFLDRNLQSVKLIKLHIHVPPLSVTSDPHVVEVSGKIIYTAYDSKESCFHAGINFLQFNLEPDLAYLRSRIASY